MWRHLGSPRSVLGWVWIDMGEFGKDLVHLISVISEPCWMWKTDTRILMRLDCSNLQSMTNVRFNFIEPPAAWTPKLSSRPLSHRLWQRSEPLHFGRQSARCFSTMAFFERTRSVGLGMELQLKGASCFRLELSLVESWIKQRFESVG